MVILGYLCLLRFTDVTVTSVNLKKAGMASRNIVIKNNTRCFKSALLKSSDFSFLFFSEQRISWGHKSRIV